MIDNFLLKAVLSRLLTEGIKTVDDLWKNNLKFYYEVTQSGGVRLALYKIEQDPKTGSAFKVIGYIALTNDMQKCGTWRVSNVASAERGYGAFLYDLGMSVIYPDFVRADDRLRDGAKQIWDNILKTSRSKYEIMPLDFNEYNQFDCETGLEAQIMARILDPIELETLPTSPLDDWEKQQLIEGGIEFFKRRYAESKPKTTEQI